MIQNLFANFKQSPWKVILILLVLSVLAHGLLIPTLGFYWDDLVYAYINHRFGPPGYPDYVALDRPHSAWIFMALTAVLGLQPLGYQISALLLYWVCAVLFWRLIRILWPHHEIEALLAAMFFIVYPGFLGHPQAIIYNHHFIAMALYLFSLIGMVHAIRASEEGRPLPKILLWHGLAVLALLLSQFLLEYFLGFEAVRLVIAWIVCTHSVKEEKVGLFIKKLGHLIPYWLVTFGFLFWRVFIFSFPTYQPIGFGEADFALRNWIVSILRQMVDIVFTTWGRIFLPLLTDDFTGAFRLAYGSVIIIVSVMVFAVFYFHLIQQKQSPDSAIIRRSAFGRQALAVSLTGILFAGWPVWITGLTYLSASPFHTRFSLAFIPWVSLLLAVGFHYLFQMRRRWIKVLGCVLIAMLVGGSAGWHFWNTNDYRNQWIELQRYSQQFVHRIPGLEPGTTIVINDLQALSLYQDDSLTALVNWIYSPENTTNELDFMVYYLSVRLGNKLPALEPGLPIEQPFRSLNFSGSTDQILVIHYDPPGCVRVLDDSGDYPVPATFPQFMMDALPLSNLAFIKDGVETQAMLLTQLFDPQPTDYWCFYFVEADLARQQGDWLRVAELGDLAFAGSDRPNEPTELFVFIEGYLRIDRPDMAYEVSQYLIERAGDIYDEHLCTLWRQAEGSTPEGFDVDYSMFCAHDQ